MEQTPAYLPWMDYAECTHHDAEFWFPERRDSETARMARAICARCPVLDDCAEWISQLETGKSIAARDGIVAGMDPEERYAADPIRVNDVHQMRVCERCGDIFEAATPRRFCDPCKAVRRATTYSTYDATKRGRKESRPQLDVS